MRIGGFQKTSLLDYPDHISAVIWTLGCDFRCPFCYNKAIVEGGTKAKALEEDKIISFLKRRKKVLEGVVITGGEPLLQKDILDFILKIKKLGYLVKIDTNGSSPARLKELIKKVDYVAMDVKAPKQKYHKLAGVKVDIKKIQRSIDIIRTEAKDYEFRTTFAPLLKKEDILEIAKWLEGTKSYYLQQFKVNPPLVSSNLERVTPYPKEYLIETLEEIKPFFKECHVRSSLSKNS
jgi:pyruvate formate lyase activating enzyme